MNLDKTTSLLLKIAEDIPEPVRNYRLASAILYKKQIVGFGVNSYKTDPFQSKYMKNPFSIFVHAEIAAIKNALKRIDVDDFKRSSLVVVRVKRNMNNTKFIPALSKPCIGCMSCIYEFGIRNVFYTNEEGKINRL